MIPGSVDPRRPEKVQRYKPNASGNGNAPGEDLTPDYMNILGPDSTRGNVQAEAKVTENTQSVEAKVISNQPQLQQQQQNVQSHDEASKTKQEATPPIVNNSTNVIPTSPQYGVAIIPIVTTATSDIALESTTPAVSTITESNTKSTENENKDMHSTPSKNDRFKVVKIASSEPFRRGRWKCMDYVDQAPPTTNQQTKTSSQAGAPTTVQIGGGVYMQTQSLPPQQIQQLLLQSALCAVQPQYFQNNMQSQILPQAQQYFYQQGVQNQNSLPQHLINAVQANSVQAQYLNANQQQQQQQQQQYFQQNFQNLQFMQPAFQNQNSAFVPTSQNIQNFQQAQTYGGQPNAPQQNVVQNQPQAAPPATQPQTIVNGYAYPAQSLTEQQIAASNLPNQVTKNVIMNSNQPNNQVQVVQNQPESQNSIPRNSTDQQQQQPTYQQPIPYIPNVNPIQNVVVLQPYDPNQANDVYANSQFVASVHTLPIIEPSEGKIEGSDAAVANASGENVDDLSKTNPVVNAIDNKIEQAMDLVKSHLMYTVREEVEVLKEKIAELMERIQQLESENNFLRSQLPKNNPNSNGTSEPPPPSQQ